MPRRWGMRTLTNRATGKLVQRPIGLVAGVVAYDRDGKVLEKLDVPA